MLILRFFFFLFFVLAPCLVEAVDFHLNTTAIGQVRDNEKNQQEAPLNGYLGLAVAGPASPLSVRTNMRFFHDADRKLDDYDLYQGVVRIHPAEFLRIDAGRQFVNQGFSVDAIDGMQIGLEPEGHIDGVVYSGIPRSVERGDFSSTIGLLTGVSIGTKNVKRTNARLHAQWRKNDIHTQHWKQNDEVFVGANLSHQFAVTMTPMVYGLVEYDTFGKVIETGTGGFDLYPTRKVALNLAFTYSDTNRDRDRKTIQQLFTKGPILSGSLTSRWTLLSHRLDFVETYSLQRIEVQKGNFQLGHIADTSLPLTLDSIGLYVEPGYSYARSFGGHFHSARLSLHEQLTEAWYVQTGASFTVYKKVTNDNDNAISSLLWTGYEILKGWTVSGGVEYNKNNEMNRDIRGSFKVAYSFDHGS